MAKVKICGITNLEDALAAFFSGADAIGFVFYKKSPRYISPTKASRISKILPRNIRKVGVFVNAPEGRIKKIARQCKLDMLQFHGDEPAEFCLKFPGFKVIKAFRVNEGFDFSKAVEYKKCSLLFDGFSRDRYGGTGRKFDWLLLRKIGKIKQKVFLSGGLNSSNVNKALRVFMPDWVDVSGGVELRPGLKDHKKIKKFISSIK